MKIKRFFATVSFAAFLMTGLGSFKVSRADSLANAVIPNPETTLSPKDNPSLSKFFAKGARIEQGLTIEKNYGLSSQHLDSINLISRLGCASAEELAALDQAGFLNVRDNMMDVLGSFNIINNAYETAINDYDANPNKEEAQNKILATIPEYSRILPDEESTTKEADTAILGHLEELWAKILFMDAAEAEKNVNDLIDMMMIGGLTDRADQPKIVFSYQDKTYEIASGDLSYIAKAGLARMTSECVYVLAHRGIKDVNSAATLNEAISVYEEAENLRAVGILTDYDVDTVVR